MSAQPLRHRFTVEDYYQMGDSGLFAPDQRLELLEGEVIEMAAIGSRHAATVTRLNHILMQALGDRAIVAVQNPVRVSDLTEPQPDLALLRWRADFYRDGHPTPEDVLLLIEVSDTTAAWDRNVKRPLYAAAGITEVWIVDLGQGVVEVATEPGPDGYSNVTQVESGTLAPLAIPDLQVEAADLLA